MKDRVTSLHLQCGMIKIYDDGANSILSVETSIGSKTLHATRSEMIEFLLDSLNLLCVGKK